MRQPAKTRNTGKKTLANSVVALSSAAVIAVYATGYARTTPAAGQFAGTETVSDTAAVPTPSPAPTVAPTATSTATAPPVNTGRGTGPGVQRGGRQQPGAPENGAGIAPPPTVAAPTATATATVTATATAATVTAPAAASAAPTGAFRDGTYTGTGTSRHGNIGVKVTVQAGKIAGAEITTCGTRYPCSIIAALPGQVVARQSAAVDAVTGATDSTNAYRAAVNAALAQAR